MLLDIRKSKSGSAVVVTDPGGDVHACTSGEELWEVVGKLLDDPEMPQPETVPPPGPRASTGSAADAEAAADALLGEFGARAVNGLLRGLQNMSHRKAPRQGRASPPTEEAGGGG
jgi:hypothetical protein